jgi:hypothetical protein
VVPNGVGTSACTAGTGAPATMVSYALTYASRPASDRNADTLAIGTIPLPVTAGRGTVCPNGPSRASERW